MWKKYILSSVLCLVALPGFSIKLLHPGVKINSQKITKIMYLVSEAEIASFTAWKINSDFYEREVIRKDTELKLYKDFNKELIGKFTNVSTAYMQASDKLISQLDGRAADRKAARRRERKAGLFGWMKGLLSSGVVMQLLGAIK